MSKNPYSLQNILYLLIIMAHSLDSGYAGNLGATTDRSGSSAQEDYYRFKLLQEKLTNHGNAILDAKSEKDQIMISILGKIINIGESSPEFAELVDLTHTRNHHEMARELADMAWKKKKYEGTLARYTPSEADLSKVFSDSAAAGKAAVAAGSSPAANFVNYVRKVVTGA